MTWEMISEARPKARKDHECQLCEWPIPAGTVYIRVAGLHDGDFWTYRAHPICDSVMVAIDDGGVADEGTPDPYAFRQLLAHVTSIEKVPYQLTPAHQVRFKVELVLPPEDQGYWDWDRWVHTGEDCPVCAGVPA